MYLRNLRSVRIKCAQNAINGMSPSMKMINMLNSSHLVPHLGGKGGKS